MTYAYKSKILRGKKKKKNPIVFVGFASPLYSKRTGMTHPY